MRSRTRKSNQEAIPVKLFNEADIEHLRAALFEIQDFIVEHVEKFGATGCVLGMSGGIDSTLVALLCAETFHHTDYSLKGYLLPSSITNDANNSDADKLAELLKIETQTIPIEGIVKEYKKVTPEAANSVFHKGNLMSRIRANILHTEAAVELKLVVGTGNRSEDIGIGYYTLLGDGAVHISPIADLPKRLVRSVISACLSSHSRERLFPNISYLLVGDKKRKEFVAVLKNILNKQPSAELEPEQTDLVDLGYTYDTVEYLVEFEKQHILTDSKYTWIDLVDDPVFKTYVETGNSLINKYQGNTEEQGVSTTPLDIIKNFRKRHATAKSKASLISPPICKVEHLIPKV